ncbi:adenosylcobinamide-GDP ribazoletransferase [Methylonatrum kenyense]|uniref:adenosylcobinamide-GDP ribazoletransferase n=1 Tax=Methylonatrum kenyense TaxID=455253 RepID=UPI0020BD5C0A|nr:adenosylcobinamide-GDP ribazoletransferase [Methylonatrum kenyense]
MSARREFGIALALLSRLPVRLPGIITASEQARSVLWYPVVGLLLGLALALSALPLQAIGVDPLVTAAVLVTLWVWFTGALHLDGLADTADAWLGSQGERERALDIMRDPACGPAGAAAIVLALLLKVVLLSAMLGYGWYALVVLPVVPVIARAACTGLFLSLPYLRPGGLGAAAGEAPPHHPGRGVLLVCAALCALVAGFAGIAMIISALATFLLFGRYLQGWLGGFTGDAAGALTEITECVALLAAVLVLTGMQ